MTSDGRRGFSLIEIMIALTILAGTLAGFATLTFRYIQSTENASATIARGAIVAQQIQRLTVLPFDSLDSRIGCTTVTTGPLPHRRCIAIAAVSFTHKTVTLIITPTRTGIKPDTTIFDRTRPPTYNPVGT